MNEEYMQHYFMPLIIVWFSLVAICMTVVPRVSKATQYINRPSATRGTTNPASTLLAAESPNDNSKELTVHECSMLPHSTTADTFLQSTSDKIFSWNRHLYATTAMLMKFALLAVFVGWIAAYRNVFDRIFLGG
ncbi:unnamed protein product, partial [Calicophoron daubneyi]